MWPDDDSATPRLLSFYISKGAELLEPMIEELAQHPLIVAGARLVQLPRRHAGEGVLAKLFEAARASRSLTSLDLSRQQLTSAASADGGH